MKFKVVAGQHHQGGKVYEKGDIVESELQLNEMFRGKFEVVDSGSDSEDVTAEDGETDESEQKPHTAKTGSAKGKARAGKGKGSDAWDKE